MENIQSVIYNYHNRGKLKRLYIMKLSRPTKKIPTLKFIISRQYAGTKQEKEDKKTKIAFFLKNTPSDVVNRSFEQKDYWDLENTAEIIRCSSPTDDRVNRRSKPKKTAKELLKNMEFSDGE